MRPLEDMSLGERVLHALMIISISCLLLVFASTESRPLVVPEPEISQWDVHMLEMDRQALDEAYKAQIILLFQSWMKDDTGQPERAVNGARQARHAYIAAMTEVAKREAKSK